jgi:ABC-type antimicrobial peptide transport system permease subunit
VKRAILEVGNAGVYAAAAGVAIGLGLCAVTLQLLKSALYGVQSYDPITLGSVVVLLAVVSLLGTFLPALRIARIDPATTLREE